MRTAHNFVLRRQAVLALVVAVCVWGASAPAAAQSPQGIGMAPRSFSGSGVVVHEEQWAKTLVDALGIGNVLPDDPDDRDLFALLCADAAEMATSADGRLAPTRAAFRISREMIEGRAPGEPVRVVLDVPATALYQLAIEGAGKQRWTVDQRLVGHVDVGGLGAALGPSLIPLGEGPHELAGYMGRGGHVDRVELQAFRPLCIAPGSGWRSGRPLTLGAQARTLVRALGLERHLPATRTVVAVEGERFHTATGQGGRTNAPVEGASGGERIGWARAGAAPAEFTYRVRLPEPGVFSIEARLTPGAQIWSVDGRYRSQVEVAEGQESFVWSHVMTTSLVAGEHVVRVQVPPGAGIERIRVIQRRSDDPSYVEVLAQMGFPTGATHSLVTRGDAFDAVFHPAFQELADGFLARAARTGPAPLVVRDDRLDPLASRPLSPVLPAGL